MFGGKEYSGEEVRPKLPALELTLTTRGAADFLRRERKASVVYAAPKAFVANVFSSAARRPSVAFEAPS